MVKYFKNTKIKDDVNYRKDVQKTSYGKERTR